jgi:signal transduction histidine kinase
MLLLGQEVVGQSPLEGLPSRALASPLARAATERVSTEVELSGLKPRRLLLDAGPLPAAVGGVVAVFIDVTEVRRLEAAPRDFASNVSDQLRAPLGVMADAAKRLQTDPPLATAAAGALLDVIDRQVRRLQGMVNEILELSRLQSQDFRLQLEPQDLARVVTGLFSRLGPQAEAKRVHLVMDVPGTLGHVLADRQALDLLLSHLLEHVLRSCARDARLHVRAVPDGRWANISVAGSGAGAERGLELSLLTELAQAMRGRLSTVDEPGRGRVFTLALPRA